MRGYTLTTADCRSGTGGCQRSTSLYEYVTKFHPLPQSTMLPMNNSIRYGVSQERQQAQLPECLTLPAPHRHSPPVGTPGLQASHPIAGEHVLPPRIRPLLHCSARGDRLSERKISTMRDGRNLAPDFRTQLSDGRKPCPRRFPHRAFDTSRFQCLSFHSRRSSRVPI